MSRRALVVGTGPTGVHIVRYLAEAEFVVSALATAIMTGEKTHAV